MNEREKHGYGFKKFWHWGMRSDLPTASQAVTPDVVYITPFTMDSIASFSPISVSGKWDYTTRVFWAYTWGITWYVGIYKRMRGTTGTAGTLELVWWASAGWSGSGAVGPITKYDFFTSSSIATGVNNPITDGQLYLAQAWNVIETGFGITTINKFGNTIPSGTWMYENSGSSTTPFPQTIAALAGTAKTDQEHWIGKR